MPLYEYECSKCGVRCEEIRGFNDQPPLCACGQQMIKLPSLFAMTQGKTVAQRHAEDVRRRQNFMKDELREKHGVHGYRPLPNSENRDFKQVYKDIKGLGSKVKDEMQASSARNKVLMREKQKKWMEGALKRTPKKREQIAERRKKEAQAARSIVVHP